MRETFGFVIKHLVGINVVGEGLKSAGSFLSAAVLSGLLGCSGQAGGEGQTLNLVSAPALAKQLGIKVSTSPCYMFTVITWPEMILSMFGDCLLLKLK